MEAAEGLISAEHNCRTEGVVPVVVGGGGGGGGGGIQIWHPRPLDHDNLHEYRILLIVLFGMQGRHDHYGASCSLWQSSQAKVTVHVLAS